MTVVGIPGRIVRESREWRRADGRIVLDHHLIPDPVGDALNRMLDRIEFLEARVTHLQGRVNPYLSGMQDAVACAGTASETAKAESSFGITEDLR
jgi:hypothetical protein